MLIKQTIGGIVSLVAADKGKHWLLTIPIIFRLN